MKLFNSIFVTIPLVGRTFGAATQAHKTTRPVQQQPSATPLPARIPIRQEDGLLVGKFGVGNNDDLDLVIDTFSSGVFLNPNRYKPSRSSHRWDRNSHLNRTMLMGNQCINATMDYDFIRDVMKAGELTVTNQTFGSISAAHSATKGSSTTQFPHDGLLGLELGFEFASTMNSNDSFFQNLKANEQLQQDQFGLALDKNGTGTLIFGGIDMDMMEDIPITQTINMDEAGWNILGTLEFPIAGEGEQLVKLFITSATQYVVGSRKAVRTLFKALNNATIHEHDSDGCGTTTATYRCTDAQPPVGFSIFDLSWYIDPTAIGQSNGDDNCTVNIIGWDGIQDDTFWYLGQTWLKGKYVDFASRTTQDFPLGLNEISIGYLKGEIDTNDGTWNGTWS